MKRKTPSTKQFLQALNTLGKPSDSIVRMLREHDSAPGRVATATVLAERTGWASYHAVNLHYGGLSKRIGRAMGQSEADLATLVDFVRPKDVTNKEWLLVMKPQFAEALRRAGWI